LVLANLTDAQSQQKQYFDRSARATSFEKGEEVKLSASIRPAQAGRGVARPVSFYSEKGTGALRI